MFNGIESVNSQGDKSPLVHYLAYTSTERDDLQGEEGLKSLAVPPTAQTAGAIEPRGLTGGGDPRSAG